MIERFDGSEGREALITALKRQEIVQGSSAIADILAKSGTLREYSPGKHLITQSACDTDVVFILAGSAEIRVNGRKLAVRRAGQHVGEMVAIDPATVRSADVVAITQTVALHLSDKVLIETANAYPSVWRAMATELAARLRERADHHSSPNDRPYLFIGSSAEQLSVARQIQSHLGYDHVHVKVWSDGGVFGASSTTINALLDQTRLADFAVFVLNPDDVVQSRGTESKATRDNVLLEFGMFVGALGLERVIGVHVRTPGHKLPSDLLGVTLLNYESTSDLAVPSNAIRERLAMGPR